MAKKTISKPIKKPAIKRKPRVKVLVIPTTKGITWEEKKLVVPLLVKRIRQASRSKKPITNDHLRHSLAKHHGIKIAAANIRKLLHYIRVNNIIKCLLAGGQGYYISRKPEKIITYVKCLESRIREINALKKAIKQQSNTIVTKYLKSLPAKKRRIIKK